MMETCIGYVTHYYSHIGVAVVTLTGPIKENDTIHFLGHSSDFYQRAWSMEIEHHRLECAGAGAQLAIKVAERVHRGDAVYLAPAATLEQTREILFEQLRERER